VKFAFIRDHQGEFPVELLCDVLKVSRSGYYAWTKRPPCAQTTRRAELVGRIREIHQANRGVYGSPRIHRELDAQGIACSENTVAKLMRQEEIRSKAKRRFVVKTTDSRHDHPVAENTLAREFYPAKPDTVWVADLTYVPTSEGWVYLATVIDLCTRMVVGWSTATHLRAELACDALRMALTSRKPKRGLLHHSDRGVQYASAEYRSLLAAHGCQASMSRRGNCYDNAVAESFFSTLKRELIHHESYRDHSEVHRSLFDYIEIFYNRRRRHSTLGYRSPAEFENRLK
jgi:transposase InsO family protein